MEVRNDIKGDEKTVKNKGFTLVELLVVIAIIAILASILFEPLLRARDMARRAVCASNLKQLYLGLMMYADDYDGVGIITHSLGFSADNLPLRHMDRHIFCQGFSCYRRLFAFQMSVN